MSDSIKPIEPAAAPFGAARFGVSDGNAGRGPLPMGEADETGEADVETLRAAFADVAEKLAAEGIELRHHVDGDLQRVIVEVVDRKDGTVLRQIPGEEALRLARMMQDRQGVLLRARA